MKTKNTGKKTSSNTAAPAQSNRAGNKESESLLEAVVKANKKASPRKAVSNSSESTGKNTDFTSTSKNAKRSVPSFDLAEELMAQQRKITAAKRKSPGTKTAAPQSPVQIESASRKEPVLLEQSLIVAEIVARDIERLCAGQRG